jgi:hypothetical protein
MQANAVGLWRHPAVIEQQLAMYLAFARPPCTQGFLGSSEAHLLVLESLCPGAWEHLDIDTYRGGPQGCEGFIQAVHMPLSCSVLHSAVAWHKMSGGDGLSCSNKFWSAVQRTLHQREQAEYQKAFGQWGPIPDQLIVTDVKHPCS